MSETRHWKTEEARLWIMLLESRHLKLSPQASTRSSTNQKRQLDKNAAVAIFLAGQPGADRSSKRRLSIEWKLSPMDLSVRVVRFHRVLFVVSGCVNLGGLCGVCRLRVVSCPIDFSDTLFAGNLRLSCRFVLRLPWGCPNPVMPFVFHVVRRRRRRLSRFCCFVKIFHSPRENVPQPLCWQRWRRRRASTV